MKPNIHIVQFTCTQLNHQLAIIILILLNANMISLLTQRALCVACHQLDSISNQTTNYDFNDYNASILLEYDAIISSNATSDYYYYEDDSLDNFKKEEKRLNTSVSTRIFNALTILTLPNTTTRSTTTTPNKASTSIKISSSTTMSTKASPSTTTSIKITTSTTISTITSTTISTTFSTTTFITTTTKRPKSSTLKTSTDENLIQNTKNYSDTISDSAFLNETLVQNVAENLNKTNIILLDHNVFK